MLPEFNLINMNGRLYDPQIGRFLSTDNYVQEPTNSQNFNRYSYCLNNPLKYTDPSGDFFHLLIGAAVGGFINWMMNRGQWNASGLVSFGVGAISSPSITNAIGGLFGHQLGSLGTELLRAGTHGIIQGTITGVSGGDFWNGFATGSASSLIGSGLEAIGTSTKMSLIGMGLSGGLTSQLTGGSFINGFMSGLSIGALNHKWEVLPDGTPHCILDDVVVTGQYKGGIPLMTVVRFAETINSTLSRYSIHAQKGNCNGYIHERGGPETTQRDKNRRIPIGIYDMDYTYSYRFKKKLYLISNSEVSKNRGIRLHTGNYYFDSTGCLLPGGYYNFNSVSNAYEVFSSGDELKKIMFLLEGNKSRLVILDSLP
jgi:RHS repeat-associated protein